MKEQNSKVRVRFAPSPTGIPHIGNTRTALFNYLFAKANKGEFILRIEDTDNKRIVKGAEEAIFEILRWLGIKHDGEVLHQSEGLDLYKKYAQELLDKKIAHKKEGAVWVKIPEDKTFEWTDQVGQKKISFAGKDVDEFVILKSDGYPTYHLANVVDDYLTKITHVIRGEEWISSTPKHLYLYESFDWQPPKFAHLSVILGPDKTKLSKRHGAKSVLDYRNEGYLQESLLNFMALLGWNPGGDIEKMDFKFMEEKFSLKDVNTANPVFDIKKLEWLNGAWIRTITDLDKRLLDFYKADKDVQKLLKSSKSQIFIKAAASRMRTLTDFKELISGKISRAKTKEEQALASKLSQSLSRELGSKNWDNENFLAALKKFSKIENIPFKIIYFLLTGKEHGIGLLELNDIYGKEFFLKNLKS
ncbi:MAG: glutamate--tRNA ligase [Patescibacteria group bacterium]|nr:glutamate--tRNA ligase [Patescibacteria group bacterium]